jgi:hypothetical protein
VVGREVVVVEDEDAEDDREPVEEAVVRREPDPRLDRREREEERPARLVRADHERGEQDLRHEHEERGRLVDGDRELVRPPADAGRKGGRLVVAHHGREVAPARIAAHELRDARLDMELEDEPEDERLRRGAGAGRVPRAPAPGRDEPADVGRLEEERVPLELEEDAPGDAEGEVEDPEDGEHEARGEPEDEGDARENADEGTPAEHGVARAEVEDARSVRERLVR